MLGESLCVVYHICIGWQVGVQRISDDIERRQNKRKVHSFYKCVKKNKIQRSNEYLLFFSVLILQRKKQEKIAKSAFACISKVQTVVHPRYPQYLFSEPLRRQPRAPWPALSHYVTQRRFIVLSLIFDSGDCAHLTNKL